MKNKLVLVWVDHTGFEFTGRYKDKMNYYKETRSVPEAKAARFSEDTPEMRRRIENHIEQEKSYPWISYYSMEDKKDMLDRAKKMALEQFNKK